MNWNQNLDSSKFLWKLHKMEIIESGDLFTSDKQTIVNTINCKGVMGKGLALSFRKEYPLMYKEYVDICNRGLMDIGKLWLYKKESKWVLNFPTKYDWRFRTELYFLEAGLEKFLATYRAKGITSIAFPLLGASNGGIDPEISLNIMQKYLGHCDIPITIYLSYKSENE